VATARRPLKKLGRTDLPSKSDPRPPSIAGQTRFFGTNKRINSVGRVIADPFVEDTDYDLTPRRANDLTAGLISLKADRMGVKLSPEDVCELFDAFQAVKHNLGSNFDVYDFSDEGLPCCSIILPKGLVNFQIEQIYNIGWSACIGGFIQTSTKLYAANVREYIAIVHTFLRPEDELGLGALW
jgi:hypothetical protein